MKLSSELDIVIDILDGKFDTLAKDILEIKRLKPKLIQKENSQEIEDIIIKKLAIVSMSLLNLKKHGNP